MAEYVVDCELMPYGDGRTLVLPVSINGHVHERITRCKDCEWCEPLDGGLCCCYRATFLHWTGPDAFCSHARPRDGDG